jgi:hypothetical protein
LGRYTHEKYAFDALTEDYFISQGYIIEVVRGIRADVVAYHHELRELAVIEVKSPNEVHGQTGWKTKHNLHDLNREEILELIEASEEYHLNPGVMKLYAYTVSSQLYTYYKEATPARIRKIMKKHTCPKIKVVPYLSVPRHYGPILKGVLKVFRDHGLIRRSPTKRAGVLVVARIRYT